MNLAHKGLFLRKLWFVTFGIFTALSFLGNAYAGQTIIYGPHKISVPLTPANTTLIFDVDDVLLKRGDIKASFVMPRDFVLTDDEVKQVERMNQWFQDNFQAFEDQTQVSEEHAYDWIATQHPIINKPVGVKNSAAAPRPMRTHLLHGYLDTTTWYDSIDIIKSLQKLGYPTALGTNIHVSTLAPLFDRSSSPCPLPKFLHVHTSDSTPTQGKLIKKPHRDYTQSMVKECFRKLQQQKSTQTGKNDFSPYVFIFIDDKLKNVESAVEHGEGEGFITIGIHYQSTEQLRNDLITLGILSNLK